MKNVLKNHTGFYQLAKLSVLAVFVLFLSSCCSETKTDETETVELCQSDYLTEAEAVQKLNEYSKLYSNAEEWELRADKIRKNIIQGAEIDKIPSEDFTYPIKVVHGATNEMNGYSVENIALEIRPGHFVTGNLYLPETISGKIPAILCPHGHWSDLDNYGRFREDMQYRCASFAKMGAVAFAYDMLGYGEDIGHIHFDERALNLQTYNGLRILDFIHSLDYVDTDRIGITGASGGGTQSFVLAAIDDRIDVSAPVVMVSAYFFGGCNCESGMPIHKKGDFETNNVEIAASIAPKPLMLVADGDDWTKNSPTVEFPYVANIYKMFGAEDNFDHAYFGDEVHNYGPSKRNAVYPFMAKHLKLNYQNILDSTGIVSEDFVVLLDTTALKVYPERSLVLKPTPW